jgi:hypothetical protein
MKLPRIRFVTLLKLGVVAGVLMAAAIVVLLPKRTGIAGWSERPAARANTVTTDAAVARAFDPKAARYDAASYEALALYLMEGWAGYRTPDAERAYYPGAKSESGHRIDGLEGFARMFPMAAAWLASGRPASIQTAQGPVDLAETFARGLAAGTDPAHPAYWGAVTSYSQRLVEAADVALGLWLSRETIWARLDAPTRTRVTAWLTDALASEPFDGNWQLFPMLVHRSLKALGVDVSRFDARMESSWMYFKQFHRGDGWFFDPPNGFDYYNAWSIHYAMFWLTRMDPTFDRAFVASTLADFAGFYKHLFGPQGQPLMGRSVCYRTAAPVPLLTAQVLAPQAVSKGEAMRALDLTWSGFIGRGALANGTVTQGFCGTDLAVVPLYTGPASCLWALRSLVVAFALDRELNLFAAERAPLPVERADFSVANKTLDWTIAGNRDSGRVVLTLGGNPEGAAPGVQPYGLKHRALEWLMHKPRRPDNNAALYGRRIYASDAPLASCPATGR